MKKLIYCYDAYCGWCYGFGPVMLKLQEDFATQLEVEVLSGGMIRPDEPRHFAPMAKYIQTAYKTVEERTGIEFGQDFLWHVFHPEETDWYPDSTKPAIALCVLKEYRPEQQLQMAWDLEYALNFEGRDLTDDEAYRHLILGYGLPVEEFYKKLHNEEYKNMALQEFSWVQQLRVTGYPTLLLQTDERRFVLLAQGFTDYETVKGRLEQVLAG